MNRMNRWRRAIAIGAVVGLAACASVPVKEKATLTLQASEVALANAQDAERSLCDASATAAVAVTHCTNPAAAAVGLTDAKHQEAARAFAKAFTAQAQSATALLAWRAGEPAPMTLTEYASDARDVLAVVRTLTGNNATAKTIADQIQAVLDGIERVNAAITGGR